MPADEEDHAGGDQDHDREADPKLRTVGPGELKGVLAMTHDPVMVGASGGRAAVMGAVPHNADTDSEVQAFVESLLVHRRIAFVKPAKAAKGAKAAVAGGVHPSHATHAIKSVGGKKVLQRTRFQCMCPGC